MARTLGLAFLILAALVNAPTAQTQTGAKQVGVGAAAPDFSLVDHHGKKVTLAEWKGKSPVVLVFYRGYW